MSLRLYGTISGWGRSAGAVIPALGSGRYSPGPNIGLPSWLKGADPHCTINVFWGQPGALATVSKFSKLFRLPSRHVGYTNIGTWGFANSIPPFFEANKTLMLITFRS